MDRLRESLVDKMGTENEVIRAILAEFLGTFFLLLIGISANIQQEMTGASATTAQLAWGFGFAFAVYTAYTVSGGHLNPAISLSSVLTGDLHPSRLLPYIFAQLLGAFVGAAAAYLGHIDDLNFLDNGVRTVVGRNATAQLFTTFPTPYMTVTGSLIDQIVGTAILALCLGLITNKRHLIPSGVVPLLAGLVLTMISMTYGTNGGFAVNPARDMGPRLFLLCIGYGWTLFTAYDYYFWIPLVGPFIGALIGTWIYKLFVGIHGADDEITITSGKVYPKDDRGYKNGGHTVAVNHSIHNSNYYMRHPNVPSQTPAPPISPPPNVLPITARLAQEYERHSYEPPTTEPRHQGSESRDPTPISWRQTTIPPFPDDSKFRIPPTSTAIERIDQLPSTTFGSAEPKREVYASMRREPDPSPPPLPQTKPPSSPVRTSLETDRPQRSNQSDRLLRSQEEQTLTYFTEPETTSTPPVKSNGPVRRTSELFAELFTPQPAKRRIPEPDRTPPVVAPRRKPNSNENPEITVSLAYYRNDQQKDPNYSYLS
ncbi:Aquaporin-10 [Aphelenchoides besseyi]|nr:Aquaporin-10 [Aphelenchoides besseyi]KAI6210896.1 Aquaporin-10 [Aphelenchoides besseyi]